MKVKLGQFEAADLMYVVVTDGFGNLVSLDREGRPLAIAEATGDEDGKATADGFMELARLTTAVLEGDAEPIDLG